MIRLIWADIKAVLNVGHTLKVIHKRIVESGIRISYPLLRVYVSRLRREESSKSASRVAVAKPTPAVRNPMANYEEHCIKNLPPRFEHREPDLKKLVGE